MAGGPLPPISAIIRNIMNMTRKTKNRIFAMPAAATEIPVKPNKPAIMAMIKNISAQYSMTLSFTIKSSGTQ
jgi:hypothetical protein